MKLIGGVKIFLENLECLRFIKHKPAITGWEDMKEKLRDEYLAQYFHPKYFPVSMVIFKIEAVVVRQWNSQPIDHLKENRMNVIQFLFLSPLLNNLPFTGEIRGASTAPFPWKGIWSVKVPKRVSFFLWTIALGKILTLDNLTKTGMSLVSWCCMCRSNGELVDHILIHCDVAYALWGVAF